MTYQRRVEIPCCPSENTRYDEHHFPDPAQKADTLSLATHFMLCARCNLIQIYKPGSARKRHNAVYRLIKTFIGNGQCDLLTSNR